MKMDNSKILSGHDINTVNGNSAQYGVDLIKIDPLLYRCCILRETHKTVCYLGYLMYAVNNICWRLVTVDGLLFAVVDSIQQQQATLW